LTYIVSPQFLGTVKSKLLRSIVDVFTDSGPYNIVVESPQYTVSVFMEVAKSFTQEPLATRDIFSITISSFVASKSKAAIKLDVSPQSTLDSQVILLLFIEFVTVSTQESTIDTIFGV